MNTEDVAKKVVELTRKQAWYDALDLYDDNVVSVEASGMGGGSPETRGHQPGFTECLTAVDSENERLVGVAGDFREFTTLRIDDELPVFAARGLAGEDRDRRLVALELHGDLVDGRAGCLGRDRGQRRVEFS